MKKAILGVVLLIVFAGYSKAITTNNLAKVTKINIPISATSIRNNTLNTLCHSSNPKYFRVLNGFTIESSSVINFIGQTIKMKFPDYLNQKFFSRSKIIEANCANSQYDYSFFLKSNNLSIDQDVLGPDLTIANNTAVCEGNSTTISTGFTSTNYIFLWKKNGVVIPNETTSSLLVTQPGIYEVVYTDISTNIVGADSIIIEYNTPPLVETFDNINACESYFLTPLTVGSYYSGSNGSGFQIPEGTLITSSQLIYIFASNGNCSNESSFMVTIDVTPIVVEPQNLIVSEENSDGIVTFDLTSQIPAILNGLPLDDFQVSFFENQSDANNNVNEIINTTEYTNSSNFQVIYFRVTNMNSDCFVLSNFVLEVVNVPVILNFQDFIIYENDSDGIAIFDLTTQIPFIINDDSNLDDYIVTFFTSYEDAIINLNQITNPTIFLSITYLGGRSTSSSIYGSIILSVQDSLSVLNFDLDKINITPNPVIDNTTIFAKENFNSIFIFNTLGQLVYEKKVNTNEEKIDLSKLTSGNYIVKIDAESGIKVLKIIKL
jgi:hypothetical protein